MQNYAQILSNLEGLDEKGVRLKSDVFGNIFAYIPNVDVKSGQFLESVRGEGKNPSSCVIDLWRKLSGGDVVVINAWCMDSRRELRWNGQKWVKNRTKVF